jgi:hypothetical protein
MGWWDDEQVQTRKKIKIMPLKREWSLEECLAMR